jgi:hypothetical protein
MSSTVGNKEKREMIEALDKSLEILNVLRADVREAGEMLATGYSNFRLRTYLRTFFALVEGSTFALKQLILMKHQHLPYLSDGELNLLREITYELDERGNITTRPKYVDTATNIRFLVRCVTKAISLESGVLFDGKGWVAFRESIRIRNQITHPKDAASLKLIDSDGVVVDPKAELGEKADVLAGGLSWYIETLQTLYSLIESEIREQYVS